VRADASMRQRLHDFSVHVEQRGIFRVARAGAVHFDHRAEVRGSRALIAHNVYAIAQKGRLHHVVGDQDAGRTGASLIHPQFLHQQAQTVGCEFIQRAEWLVQKQYVC